MKYITVNEDDLKFSDWLPVKGYSLAPTDGGIYFLYSFRCNLLYIGKAKNIQMRLSQYYNDGSHLYKVAHNFFAFRYVIVDEPVERDMLETYYINKLQPPLNQEKTFTYTSSRHDKKYTSHGEDSEFADEFAESFKKVLGYEVTAEDFRRYYDYTPVIRGDEDEEDELEQENP